MSFSDWTPPYIYVQKKTYALSDLTRVILLSLTVDIDSDRRDHYIATRWSIFLLKLFPCRESGIGADVAHSGRQKKRGIKWVGSQSHT